jgi:predicted RNase H-like HicB family nuclease
LPFIVEVEQEVDGRWIAEIPEIPGCMMYGQTRAEAIALAESLAARVMADRIDKCQGVPPKTVSSPADLWERYLMALDAVTDRLHRITRALEAAGVDYALVGGQAVALWVATKDPEAVRTTKDVDILLRRQDLPKARAAAASVAMDYFEALGVGMFLDRSDPNPRKGIHLLWSGEKVRAENPLPAPTVDEREILGPGKQVVSLAGLVRMKLLSNRDQDRVHLRDMIEVDLVHRDLLKTLPAELAGRLDLLLSEAGR